MMMKRGTNIHTRMAWAARQEADGRLVLPSFQPQPATAPAGHCPHPLSEHGDAGCYHGWGDPEHPEGGCTCMVRGMFDEQRRA